MKPRISRAESDFSGRPIGRMKRAGLCVAAALVLLALGASSASAAEPWWQLSSSSAPAHLQPGACEGFNEPQALPQCGQVVVRAENLGDLSLSGSSTPVTISDVLPAGVRAVGIARTQTSFAQANEHGSLACSPASPATVFPAAGVTCTWGEAFALPPYEVLEVAIYVEVEPGASSGENEVAVSGGEGYACEKQEGGVFTTSLCAGATYSVPSTGSYEAHLTAREVAPASLKRPVMIGGPTSFGVEEYTFTNENEGGAADTQAGSHPFQQTTNIALDQGTPVEGAQPSNYTAKPPALAKDLHFQWPAGLIGNATVLPQCTEVQFSTEVNGGVNLCEADTAVGVASVTIVPEHDPAGGLRTEEVPVFNLVPSRGEPARFGFEVQKATVIIDPSVRTGSDYGITVNVENIDQVVAFVASRVTVWGVPGDPSHDNERGWGCMEGGAFVRESSVASCTPEDERNPPAFLSLPTSCTGPLHTSVEADSWQEPGDVLTYGPSVAMPALDGCDRLPFGASMEVAPDVQEASTPTGLMVKVHVPQEASVAGEGLAGSDVKDTTVTLPEGVAVNPANANGLQACTGDPGDQPGTPGNEIGFTGSEELDKSTEPGVQTPQFTAYLPGSPGAKVAVEAHEIPESEGTLVPGVNFCPDASKIANATIDVPVIAHPLKGAVYLASPQNFSVLTGAPPENPFESLIAMYLVAEDPVSGVLIKLPGKVSLSPSGQLTTSFEDTPQAPFENLELEFFGGERAPLATPVLCRRPGEEGYQTLASFTPWSGNAAIPASTEFDITSGPNGGPCPNAAGDQSPSSLPFSPSLASGTTNNNAGSFAPLTTTLSRPDGDQNIQSVVLRYPPGVSGMITGVPLCAEAQANAGDCSESSLVGETTVSVGLGGDPFTVTGGKVYLTEPYEGAPFGLSIVTPAKAGPFDLQEGRPVVVRAKIEINPVTAAMTVTAGPIPTIIEGIPLQIQHVNVTITRPSFTFNPTNCDPMSITGSLASAEGASSPLSVPFQATNCTALKFQPKLTVTTAGHATKKDGASLTFKISYPKGAMGTDAWFKAAKFDIPKQLPARLTTIQQACIAATFETNPADCPKHSKIGEAVVHTQVLPVPLKGPVYFVSYGKAKFPDAIILLSGDNVNVRLTGETFINGKTGVTSATFPANPDVPFESIEVTLPTGEYSEFGANLPNKDHDDFCGQTLKMPTAFQAQNGLEIHQQTPVTITGCPKPKKTKAKKHNKKNSKNKHKTKTTHKKK
jgi:hypothetical protein